MSTHKHTPGPWRCLPEEVDKDYIRVRGTRSGGRYKVANVLTPTYMGATPGDANETRANARLIAAAPTLLAALITARDLLAIEGHSVGASMTEINAAIDQATRVQA